MREETVANLKESLEAVLQIDPEARYRFENCGSGTYALNLYISKEAAKSLTHEQLDKLDNEYNVGSNDEEELSVEQRLGADEGEDPRLFFVFL